MNYTKQYAISLDKATELHIRREDLKEMIAELKEGYPSQQSPTSKAAFTRSINKYQKELEAINQELATGPPVIDLNPKTITEHLLDHIQETEDRFNNKIQEFRNHISNQDKDILEEIRWHLAETAIYQGMLDAMKRCSLLDAQQHKGNMPFEELFRFLQRTTEILLDDILRMRTSSTSNPVQNVIQNARADGRKEFYRLYLSNWVARIEDDYDQVVTWHKLRSLDDWVSIEHYETTEEEKSS